MRNGSRAKKSAEAEAARLAEDARREKNWKRWGPYLSERQWGTVREDYSPSGSCWNYFPHDHARSRAYRWGEDGLLGITDREGRLCFALALWNGRDPILKERLFGLTGSEGNHGEDVKESYFYLDSTPTHSYMKALYKYPQGEVPYSLLVEENRRRGKLDPEFELADTGVFDENRYFDVFGEYAKAASEDVLIRITIANRGSEAARLSVLPTLWFRNTWSWGRTGEGYWGKPSIAAETGSVLVADHEDLGQFRLYAEEQPVAPELLFTENETNAARLFGSANTSPWVKDAFHEYVVGGRGGAVNPGRTGTKAAALYRLEVPAGGQIIVRLRLCSDSQAPAQPFGPEFDRTFQERMAEADAFYAERLPAELRKRGRNSGWPHLYNRDVISMPDKWEYPWYAAWDLAFHMVPMARIDPEFAKQQLLLFMREWYMHPNGQLPAYEWALGDVNPPVHAWACWRVYKLTGPRGRRDRLFLERAFQKLLINFTWWVNRKDPDGRNIFAGGFLGLDNIGVFDRSRPLPTGGHLEQADGTAWMAFYCATMLSMALELASGDPAYEDVASKFFEHFVAITDSINTLGGTGLWEEEDGFYYDQLHVDGRHFPLKLRSMVGLVPLFAVEVLEESVIAKLPGFRKRMQWFLENRTDLARHISYMEGRLGDVHGHRLLAIPSKERLARVLECLFDEEEFLSAHGIRALSRVYGERPYTLSVGAEEFRVAYDPGESTTSVFGGNSNWRGPVWFPVNYLLVEALERYHHYYGDLLQVEFPSGSGRRVNLRSVALELAGRLCATFLPDENGRRPCHGDDRRYAEDPHWKDLVLFHEYFHGETGRGVGASHQTGWTAVVVRLLKDIARSRGRT